MPAESRRGVGGGIARALAVAICVGFVALLAYGLIARSPDRGIDDALAKAQAVPAPSFDLEVLQGGDLGPKLSGRLARPMADGRLSLAELRGTPTVLNFWASWCIPCREEAPLLQRTWRRAARPAGVLFLGLDLQDDRDDARGFLRTFDVDYLNIREPGNDIARRYGTTGIPETFFISAAGKVVGHVIGVTTAAQLRDGIAAAIAGRPAGAERGGDRRALK